MRVEVNEGHLWFDVSGPSVVIETDRVWSRPTLVAVHGGPGVDHSTLKASLAPLTDSVQVIFYDQRGHGRSDYGTPDQWNLHGWATDLRDLCDTLGLIHPVVLGSSFGGFVVATYAAMFPDHPAGIVLTNTTGGRTDHTVSLEMFRRLGGDEAAAVFQRDIDEITAESADEWNRVCYPLFSAKPGYVEETRRRMRLAIQTTEVNLHYWRNEAPHTDPWELLANVRCPALVIAGEDDPICPLPLVEDFVRHLTNASQVELLRLRGARHAVFRDAPDIVFPALLRFLEEHATGSEV